MNRVNVYTTENELKEIAQKTDCAVVLVGHMNKNSSGKLNYKNSGSIDISTAARSVLVAGRLSKSSEIKVLALLKKNNLVPKGKSITFKIENRMVKSTVPVRSLKKNGIWYWEMNGKEVGNHAEQ